MSSGAMLFRRALSIFCAAWMVGALAMADDGGRITRGCGGGEGPKPLVDISASFPHDTHAVPTAGSVEDFLFWETKGHIVYRNDSSQLFETSLSGDQKAFLAGSSEPISQVTDEEERFVITAGDTWFLDTWSGDGWIHYNAPFDEPQHLFWHNRHLFSIASTFSDSGEQRLELYRYRAGAWAARRICPFLKFNPGEGYHVGEGHVYPWVLLYRTQQTGRGTVLTLDRLNVATCRIEPTTYSDIIEGDVQSVHWFPAIDSVAVKIDHPTKNLLWDTGPDAEHCQYFNIGQKTPLIPLNHRFPIVAAFDHEQGLRVFRLGKTLKEDSKAATILKDLPISDVSPDDMWLTSDAQTLFVAPKLIDQTKYLVKLELPAAYKR